MTTSAISWILDESTRVQVLEVVENEGILSLMYGGKPIGFAGFTTGIGYQILTPGQEPILRDSDSSSLAPYTESEIVSYDPFQTVEVPTTVSEDQAEFYAFGYPRLGTVNSEFVITGAGSSTGGNFPGSPNLPVSLIDFELLGAGPILVEITDTGEFADSFVEFSDAVNYPSVVAVDPQIGFTAVNDLTQADQDYIYFEIPEGSSFDRFTLEAEAPNLVSGQSLATYSIINEDSREEVSGSIAASDTIDSETDLLGANLTEIGPGRYSMYIASDTASEAAYSLILGKNIDTGVESFGPYILEEDDSDVIIPLPLGFDWSNARGLPFGLELELLNGESGSLSAEYAVVGALPANVYGNFDAVLLAEAHPEAVIQGAADQNLPISIINLNDTPVLGGVASFSGAVEDQEFLITYDDLLAAANVDDVDLAPADYAANLSFLVSTSGEAEINGLVANSIQVSEGDSFTWKAPQDQSGFLAGFTVLAIDDEGDVSAEPASIVSINVAPQNDVPKLFAVPQLPIEVTEDAFYSDQFFGSDVEDFQAGLPLTFSLLNEAPAGLDFRSDGSWSFDASTSEYQSLAQDRTQDIVIPFELKDSEGGTLNSSFTIRVVGANDQPEAFERELFFAESEPGSSPHIIQIPEFDVDGDQLTIQPLSSDIPGLSINESGQLVFDASHPDFDYLPQGETLVLETAFFEVFDSSGFFAQSNSSISITVSGRNDLPVLESLAPLNVVAIEDEPQVISFNDLSSVAVISDVDINASDGFFVESIAAGAQLEILSVDETDEGPFDWSAANPVVPGDAFDQDSVLRWTSPANLNGLEFDAFTVKAWDGIDVSESSIPVRLDVLAANDRPTISAINPSFEVLEGQDFSTSLSGETVDEGEDVLFSIVDGLDSDFFSLIGGELRLRETTDYEAKSLYQVEVLGTDTSLDQLESDPLALTLSVADKQDQALTLVPQSGSEVLLPDTKALTFDLSYSQDPAVGTADASFFDAELSFDHTRVTLDQTSSLFDNDQITWDVTTSGVIKVSSAEADRFRSEFTSSLGQLHFDIALDQQGENPSLEPLEFNLSQTGDSPNFEQLPTGAIVAPNVDVFFDAPSQTLDLSAFRTPLEVIPAKREVSLIGYDNVAPLGYSPELSLSRLITTASDDVIDLQGALSSLGDIRTGAGRDVIVLPPPAADDSAHDHFNLQDFELGLDALGIDGLAIRNRDEILALAAPSSHLAVQLDFAAVAVDLDPGTHRIYSGQSSLLSQSLLLDAGSIGEQLKVTLSGDPSMKLDVMFDFGDTDWQWSLADLDRSALLSWQGSGDPLQAHSELQNAMQALTVQASEAGQASFELKWLGAAANSPQSSLTRNIDVQVPDESSQPLQGLIDLRDTHTPVKLELVSLLPDPDQPATELLATNGDDTVLLLSRSLDMTDKVYGGGGSDLITIGDGDRGLGGLGSDHLLALMGNKGTTQLIGEDGNDVLIGGLNDALVGGSGDDVLAVRGNGNRLIGGSGSDQFVLFDFNTGFDTTGNGLNRVIDFTAADRLVFNLPGLNSDRLDIHEFGSGSRVTLLDDNGSALQDLAIIQGSGASQISSDQILINPRAGVLPADLMAQAAIHDQSWESSR